MEGLLEKKSGKSINLTTGQVHLLDLISLSKEKSRSQTVAEMIEMYQGEILSLVEIIMLRLWGTWQDSDHSFTDFIELADNWLHKKKVTQAHIDLIIKALEDKHGKKK